MANPISKPAFLILDISTDQYWQAFSGNAQRKALVLLEKFQGLQGDLPIRYIRSTLRLNFHQIWLNIHLFHIYLMDTSNFYLPIDMKSTGYHRFFSWQPERYLGSEVRHDCQQRIAGPLIGMIWITMNHYESLWIPIYFCQFWGGLFLVNYCQYPHYIGDSQNPDCTYIRTYIRTYINTYRQTDRQTDR